MWWSPLGVTCGVGGDVGVLHGERVAGGGGLGEGGGGRVGGVGPLGREGRFAKRPSGVLQAFAGFMADGLKPSVLSIVCGRCQNQDKGSKRLVPRRVR